MLESPFGPGETVNHSGPATLESSYSPGETVNHSGPATLKSSYSPGEAVNHSGLAILQPLGPTDSTMRMVEPPGLSAEVYARLVSPGVSCEESCTGDFLLQVLNDAAPPRLVRKLDLSALPKQAIGMAAGGGAGDVIFRGEFTLPGVARPEAIAPLPGEPTFVVQEAWRGLPDVTAPPLALYTTVGIFDGYLIAHLLDSPWGRPIESVSVAGMAPAWVDPAWITTRVMDHGAIVAGRFDGWTLDAAQVFLRLPDVVGPCPIEDWAVHCAADEVAT
jgi:hypothetical protein